MCRVWVDFRPHPLHKKREDVRPMDLDGGKLSSSVQLGNETAVIGSLLKDPGTLETIDGILTTADFQIDLCREAFAAALRLREGKKEIDALLIREEMGQAVQLDCTRFLVECTELCATAANVAEYCRLVKDEANRRRLERISLEIHDGVQGFSDWREVASSALDQIADVSGDSDSGVMDSRAMALAWREYYDQVVKNPGFAFCKTGYPSLDRKLGGGMYRSGMYIVGARPGMGKTTLGINIAENIAGGGKPVLFVSLEMGRVQIMCKRMACFAGISYTKLMAGGLSPQGMEEAALTAETLSQHPFFISDKSGACAADIGRMARRIKGLSAIVVDYLGLMRPRSESANKPRYEQMTEISADIKALAKALEVPILVLCQLNRENAKDGDKRPQLQHLRDSGAIEQDADAVVLLHRKEYYSKDRLEPDYVPPEWEELEVIVAKNRHGETGIVKMQWRGLTGEIQETYRGEERGLPF